MKSFSEQMRAVRHALEHANDLYYQQAIQRRFLAAVEKYYMAVEVFATALATFNLASGGLHGLRDYLTQYTMSAEFRRLVSETQKLTLDLSAIKYSVVLNDGSINVREYGGESDYSTRVEDTFRKFRQGAIDAHPLRMPHSEGFTHIEAQVISRVALLFPDIFQALDVFCNVHATFIDDTVARFDREVQFYVAYLAHIANFGSSGLNFCYPRFRERRRRFAVTTLSTLRSQTNSSRKRVVLSATVFTWTVRNASSLFPARTKVEKPRSRRMFGQLHYLASLGCAVPGTEAKLFLLDQMFAHFEREEDITNLRGKLQDDLIRIRQILECATTNSIVVMNEIFSSTTVQDALFLSREVMRQLCDLDVLGVCVTFLDELAALNEKTVSVVGKVDPRNPELRTYKLERRPADGLAYALAVAEKHHVTSMLAEWSASQNESAADVSRPGLRFRTAAAVERGRPSTGPRVGKAVSRHGRPG